MTKAPYDSCVYLSSIPNPQRPSRKREVLLSFHTGVSKVTGCTYLQDRPDVLSQRLAVILGAVHKNPQTEHLRLRYNVIQKQEADRFKTMYIDSSCFKYVDKFDRYLRYSIDGVFYDKHQYANKNSNSRKWEMIKKDLQLDKKPWKKDGGYILLCMQRDGGWSMKNINPIDWAANKIAEIKQRTTLPIYVRPHPGKLIDVKPLLGLGVTFTDSKSKPLLHDLQGAKVALFYNSSAAVAAALEGVPLFIDDDSCPAAAVANRNIDDILSPKMFPRSQWLFDLCAAHWNDEESRQGLIYQKFSQYLR